LKYVFYFFGTTFDYKTNLTSPMAGETTSTYESENPSNRFTVIRQTVFELWKMKETGAKELSALEVDDHRRRSYLGYWRGEVARSERYASKRVVDDGYYDTFAPFWKRWRTQLLPCRRRGTGFDYNIRKDACRRLSRITTNATSIHVNKMYHKGFSQTSTPNETALPKPGKPSMKPFRKGSLIVNNGHGSEAG
jgi:hypothetical protein